MKSPGHLISRCITRFAVVGACLAWLCLANTAVALERVRVAKDGKGFVTEPSGKAFVPWGVNYGNHGRLMEDFWEDWDVIAADFAEIKALGGNVLRVHLQFDKFMTAADEPRAPALAKLRDLIALAEKTGVYLDLTGLACYRPADRPKWYDTMDDAARWKQQAVFWRAIAGECAGTPAVFCYNLMNEPVVPGEKTEKWYSGALLGGLDFLQNIVREPAGRPRMEIAAAWIDTLTAAIRKKDKETMVTVGMLPWVTGWQHLSGFLPKEVAKHVDFLSVHIYPKTKHPDEAPRALAECATDKPVVIEETFPLECSVGELEAFLRESRKSASGWVWHYDGITLAEYEEKKTAGKMSLAEGVWRAALQSFQRLGPEFVSATK